MGKDSDKKAHGALPAETDVAIVGGGLAGIFIAYLLSKEGKKVAVLEKNKIGSGATGLTTAIITKYIDTGLADLISMFGIPTTKTILEAGEKAIQLIKETAQKEKIEADLVSVSNFAYASSESQAKTLTEEMSAAKKLGERDVTLNFDEKLRFPNFGYLEVKNQAKFDAGKFIEGLAGAARRRGAVILEKTEAKEIKSGAQISIITNKGTVTANQVVVATYDPFNNPRTVFAKKGMYVTYVLTADIPKGALMEATYEDQSNPYYYFRIDKKDSRHDTITLGGADHRKEIPMSKEKNFKALEEHLEMLVPGKKIITKRWIGPILEPSDGLALIGEYKKNHYLASAFSGTGMIYSAISALLITDAILGRKNPAAEIFDPKRKRKVRLYLKKGLDYTEEFFGGAVRNSLKYRKTRAKKKK